MTGKGNAIIPAAKPAAEPPRYEIDDETIDLAFLDEARRAHETLPPRPQAAETSFDVWDGLQTAALGFVVGLAILMPTALLLATDDFGVPTVPNWTATQSIGADVALVPILDVQQRSAESLELGPQQVAAARGQGASGPAGSADADPRLLEQAPTTRLTMAGPAALIDPEYRPREANAAEAASVARAAALTIMAQAEALLSSGEIERARDLLASAREIGGRDVVFRLAQTYDPNHLGKAGLSLDRADADKALGLYVQALEAGEARALEAIEALRP
ncbi:MAG: hypothetical protein ACFCUN_10525 [Hyphomicrobiaceae bacterium]